MPTNFTNVERNNLLGILQVGKRNAKNAKTIAQALGFPVGGNQVKTRDLIRECIEVDNDLIASTLSKPRGFYLVDKTNKSEAESYIDSLENRAKDILKRREWLIRNWNKAVPNNLTNKVVKSVKI